MKSPNLGKVFRRILLATILAGIPGLFFFFLLARLDETAGREQRRDEIEQMRKILGRTAESANLQRRFGELLTRLAQRTRFPATARTHARAMAKLVQSNPGLVDLALFDREGKRVALPGFPSEMMFASQRFLEAIRKPERTIPAKLIEGFAGNPEAPRLMRLAPSTLIDLLNGDRRTWGGWWPLQDASGKPVGDMIAFVHRAGIAPDILIDRTITATNKLTAGRFRCGWRDPLNPKRLRPDEASFPPEIMTALDTLPTGHIESSVLGRSLAVQTADEGEQLFALADSVCGEQQRYGKWREWLLLATILGGWLVAGSLLESRSLRARLVWNILIGAGFPLAVFFTAVMLDRQAREDLLLQNVRTSHLETLIRLDGDFHSYLLPLRRRYHGIEKNIERMIRFDRPVPAEDLRRFAAASKGLVKGFAIIDEHGRRRFVERYQHGIPIPTTGEAGEMLPIYALNILRMVNGEVMIGSDSAGVQRNPIAEMLIQTKSPQQWFDDNQVFQNNTIGKDAALAYFRLFPGRKLTFGCIFMAEHDSRLAQVRYLRGRSRHAKNAPADAPVLLAVPVNPSLDCPSFPGPATERHQVIRAFRDLILAAGLPQHQMATIRGRPYMLSGLRGRFNDEYILILAQSVNEIHQRSWEDTRRAGILVLLGLLLAGGTAWLASRRLLTPLADLEHGLVALRNRDFSATVKPGRLTELAQVADRLNLTISGLRDLELAKTVQEHLWPERGLRGDGWEIAGRCVTATDLGGDHHDWFMLPDGRLVVALGDVAGHGIPSGLVAASAKVALALYAESEPTPHAILLGMNRSIQEQTGRARPMTFWLGLFDPKERTLSFANAGQCYPILLAGDDPPCMIEMPGMPLGSVKKPNFSQGHIDLRRGGRLYLYSDGLIEASTVAEEMFGYPKMLKTLGDLRAVSCSEALQRVFALVHAFSGKAIPDDDQTMVILDVEPRP